MNISYYISRIMLYSAFTIALYIAYTVIYLHPCQRTLTYSIGTIQPANAIEHWRLEELLWNAEDAWEKPTGLQLFLYKNTGGDMTINIDIKPELNNSTPGQIFEKGSNYRDNIVINHFRNEQDLSLVLAHEFGHSLGMGHVDDPNAIMHDVLPQNTSMPPQPTLSDLIDLSRVCRKYKK